jgi:NAD-dependent deacetylase
MKKVVFLTGAGMSVESGLSTFRGSGGMWNEYKIEDVASIEGYERNPALVLEFYNKRRQELLTVAPNEGHRLIAELEKHNEVVVVTQNVDDLHERAGSTNVIHLHGELMKATSTDSPNNLSYVRTLTQENLEIKIGDKADDGSQLRPYIVWFGEAVPMMEDAVLALRDADAFVIIGTSLNVYPAAGLLNYAPAGIPIYLIDPNDVQPYLPARIKVIKSGASEGMKSLFALLSGEH